MIKQVKKHKFLADYEKTKEYFTKQDNDIYLKLKPFLSKAKANAKKLGEFDFNNPQSAMSQMQLLFDTEVLNLSIEEKNR